MTTQKPFHLENAPIIEVILDIDCDLPPSFQLQSAEADLLSLLGDAYPKTRHQMVQEHQVFAQADAPPQISLRSGLQALQFLSVDERQIVQFRTGGFSFNRLAPYSQLDDYLPEIERTWRLFVEKAGPLLIRKIGLRTINKIQLPVAQGKVSLQDYIQTGPRLPDEKSLVLTGFLDQHKALETATGNNVNIVLTTLDADAEHLPLILDIDAFRPLQTDSTSWPELLEILGSLRGLKNRVFRNTLTDRCLNLSSQSA
jgi:uncharacterized protein (TIGR04255 family)